MVGKISLQIVSGESQVQSWEYSYLLRAPVDGAVSITGFFQENEEVKAGEVSFYVHPPNTSYYAEALIPQYNSEKVKTGQEVLLKFQAYPFAQYGIIRGKIDHIKTEPNDSGYLAKIILPKGLTTNYNNTLRYRNRMVAEADIITENMRLIDRFLINTKKQFAR